MSTSLELRNQRTFAAAQARRDASEPRSFWDDEDEDVSQVSIQEDGNGDDVEVVFQMWCGFADIIGVIRDGRLCENFSQVDAARWCKNIDKEQSC